MAKETDKSRLDNQQLTPEVEARLEQMVQQRMEALAAKLQAPAVPSVLDDLPERLVEAERQVREQAVIVNQEAHSRAQRRLAVEQKLEEYDDKDTKPYILYSTELCPQQAPALAGHEFPKYILKKTGRNRPDVAEKKVAWLTDREAARIRMVAELKFMKVPVLDEQGKPVLDKRSSAPLQKAVPYSAFIRLIPTVTLVGADAPVGDPGMLLATYQSELARVKAELEAFRTHNEPAAQEPDAALGKVNKELKEFRRTAQQAEAEADKRREGRESTPVA